MPWPAWTSTGLTGAIPLHSDTLALASLGLERLTVTLVTGRAAIVNQISMRLLEPGVKPTGPLVQVLPAESVTDDTEAELPVWRAIGATSAFPFADRIGMVKLVVVVGVLPVACPTKVMPPPPPPGVVTVSGLLNDDALPAGSTARTS